MDVNKELVISGEKVGEKLYENFDHINKVVSNISMLGKSNVGEATQVLIELCIIASEPVPKEIYRRESVTDEEWADIMTFTLSMYNKALEECNLHAKEELGF